MSATGLKTQREQIRYSIQNLRDLASARPPGHFEEFMAHAVQKSRDGKYIWLEREDAARLSDKYRAHWQPEFAARSKPNKPPGPLWWRAYTGKRTALEIAEDLKNLFDFEVPPATPLLAEFRQRANEALDEQTNCTPCQMTTIVNRVTFDYIYKLNQYESDPKPE